MDSKTRKLDGRVVKIRSGVKDVYDLDKNLHIRYQYSPEMSRMYPPVIHDDIAYGFLLEKLIWYMGDCVDDLIERQYIHMSIGELTLRELYCDPEHFWKNNIVLPDAIDTYEDGHTKTIRMTSNGSFLVDDPWSQLKLLSPESFRKLAAEIAKLSDTTDEQHMITIDSLNL